MPTATAEHAALGDRRVEHALVAVLFLQPVGDAEDAAVEPDILAEDQTSGSRASITSIAELSAWTIVIAGIGLDPQFLALAAQMRGASP